MGLRPVGETASRLAGTRTPRRILHRRRGPRQRGRGRVAERQVPRHAFDHARPAFLRTFDVTLASDSDLYYDPYDFEIDADPYPVWRRLRDEAPLYRNERYDFWALSRFADVEAASTDWRSYSSGRGSVLEMITSGMPVAPGTILFEDPRSE